jgi:hypothetical protein
VARVLIVSAFHQNFPNVKPAKVEEEYMCQSRMKSARVALAQEFFVITVLPVPCAEGKEGYGV